MTNNLITPESLGIIPLADDEVFKPASYRNEPLLDFLISNYGRLYSIKRQKLNSPYFCKFTDKAVYKINCNGKSKEPYIKNLVAEAFIPNPHPETYIYVRHIDMNKRNNSADNLEWCENVTPKKQFDETINIRDIELIADDEKFAIVKIGNTTYANYLISNYGRLYSRRSGFFLKGRPCADRYTTYMLGTDGKRNYISAHRLVAFAFVHNPNLELFNTVNHKDENKLNNYYKNLEWCTDSYNKQYNGASFKKRIVQVKQYDENGKLVAIHNNMTAAGRVIGVGMSTIRFWCKNSDKYFRGYRWERVL